MFAYCAALRSGEASFQVPATNVTEGASSSDQRRLFQVWTYQTQLWQARAYETAITLWRRLKADADASTMGILCARCHAHIMQHKPHAPQTLQSYEVEISM